MAAAKGKSTVSADITDDVRDELDARAKREGRSRGKAIEIAIRFWLRYAEEQEPEPLPLPKTEKGKK